jgi:hypothetical protein
LYNLGFLLIGNARLLAFSTAVGPHIEIAILLNIELWDLVGDNGMHQCNLAYQHTEKQQRVLTHRSRRHCSA